MLDSRVIALFFLAGWRVCDISSLFRIPQSGVQGNICREARKVGTLKYCVFKERADQYRAQIQREEAI